MTHKAGLQHVVFRGELINRYMNKLGQTNTLRQILTQVIKHGVTNFMYKIIIRCLH